MGKRWLDERVDQSHHSHGFALGVFVGAALVFLFGTEEGRRLKRQLTQRGRQLAEEMPSVVKKLQKEGEAFAHKAEKIKQDLEEKLDTFTPRAKAEITHALEHIEKTQERGRQAASVAKKRFFTRRGRAIT